MSVEQASLRRRPALGQPDRLGWQSFAHQVSEYLLDNHGVFNAGDHFDAAATLSAHLDIDVEDALEALHPEPAPDLIRGHDRPTFDRRLVLRLIRRFGRVTLTPFGGRHQRTVLAVRGEYTVKAGEVDSWLGHQGSEARQSKLDSGKTDSEATLRGAARTVSKTSQFTEVLTVEGGEDVTVTKSVTGLSSQINGSLSMKTTYTYKNTSEAPLGVEDTDTETAVTLVYKL